MTHHPHVHMIVPGGGLSLDGVRWVPCRPGFLLPVRVLSRLFRRLFLDGLADAHAAGRLAFFGDLGSLRNPAAFTAHLAPLRKKNWFVYAKPPFAGPEAVLAYLARYTHRVAISNSRLLALDERGVTFRYKDYRRNGRERLRTMTLAPDEFIRRFLLHVLPALSLAHRSSALCLTQLPSRSITGAGEQISNRPSKTHSSPASAAPAASSTSPYRKCPGGKHLRFPRRSRAGALVDRVLRYFNSCALMKPYLHNASP
jgi:hypothetical protein